MIKVLSVWRQPVIFLLLIYSNVAVAQFTNRYPKVSTYRHHIYLEAFEFPFYSNGPVSPVASPDGKLVAFSAFGWIWVYDKKSEVASRLTAGTENDFSPTWSADGRQIAFVRDTGRETYIQIINRKGEEVDKIDHSNSSELDPYFSPDGKFLYYSSSAEGTFDIWRVELTSFDREKVISDPTGLEMRPVPYGQTGNFYFISKAEGVVDRIKHFEATTGEITTIDEGRVLSQLWMDTNTSGEQLVLNWSNTLTWNLNIKRGKMGAPKLELFGDEHYVIYPSWNRQDSSILFSMAGDDLVFNMYEIPEVGGDLKRLTIKSWDYGTLVKKKSFVIQLEGKQSFARISAVADNGHFVIPAGVVPRFDSQNGEIYFYTDGKFSLSIPSDKVKLKVSHGLFSTATTDWIDTGNNVETVIELKKGWDKPGWYTGDHHFHLNYGGPFKLKPADLIPVLKGEDLDFATPMSANLHFQLKDQEYMDWENETFPKVKFGQEIRSHFHGHIGLFGNNKLYFPWFWGPLLYESRTFDDRLNNEPLIFGRQNGQIGAYVHPISEKNPIADEASMARIPVGLIADVVNKNLDAFEMACLWSDELGSSTMYHQFLNLGIPVALTAGTDAFPGYARSMAVGTTRIVVSAGSDPDWNEYLDGIRKGKSVVTNGPMIDLRIEDVGLGGILKSGSKKAKWEMEVYTPTEIDQIEILVNGKVVWKSNKTQRTGTNAYSGSFGLPKGGWVAARVVGKKSSWPQMDSYTFAHTSPIWIEKIGSFDPVVRSQTAIVMLKAMDIAWMKIREAYKNNSVEGQESYFAEARKRLEEMVIR